MSNEYKKKRTFNNVEQTKDEQTFECLPSTCKGTVRTHVNTVYVVTIICIYDKNVGPEGHLVTAHWAVNGRLFVTLHGQCVSKFIRLDNQHWVVDHQAVKPGSIILARRHGTNDITDSFKK